MRLLARRPPGGILAGADSSPGPAVAALLVISLTFYHRLWLPDLVLIKRDAFRYFLPLKQYIIERLTTGELPQWLPYDGFGRPFVGASGIGLFHPFTALYFLLPVPDAYRAATLVSCVLAGLGAFAVGRALALSRAGALLAGLAFALSGYVVSLTDNLLYLYSICVLPLFCAGLEKALAQPVPWVVAPAVVWATVFLNGDVQTGYYYGCIAIFWAIARAPGSYQAASVRLALILGLTGLLAGIQLGPAAAAYAGSERAQPAAFRDQALQWSTHPLRLLTVAASPVGGDADPVEVSHRFFGSRPAGEFPVELWAESLYLGVPILGLAWLGARYRRDLRGLTLLGGLALVLALGRYGGLYELFFHVVPFWSSFRYPEKLMGVASLAAALLAGAGLDVLGATKGRPPLWFVTAAVCVGAWLVFRSDGFSVWTAAAVHAPEALAREVTDSAALAFLLSALASVVVGLILVGVHRGWLGWELAHALLIVVIVVDLSRVNLGAYHTGPLEAATFTPGLVEAIRQHAGVLGPGHFRLSSIEETEFVSREELSRWLSPVGITSLMLRQSLDVEHNAQFQIESSRLYLPGYNPGLVSFDWQKFGIEAAARYNVAYFIGRSFHFKSPRFAQAFVAGLRDYDLVLVKNPVPVKPRVYLSSRPERAASPVDLAALVGRPDFLSGEVDVIETEETTLPGPTRGGSAVIERYAPEEVLVRVSTSEAAVLVLLDTFDAGWKATLETGVGCVIRRVNGFVRAVVVPAGDHRVRFHYQTPLLKAGALASLAGLVIGLALVAHAWLLKRQRSGNP